MESSFFLVRKRNFSSFQEVKGYYRTFSMKKSKHPSHLKGSQIGLWYRDHQQKNRSSGGGGGDRKSDEFVNFTLSSEHLKEIKELIATRRQRSRPECSSSPPYPESSSTSSEEDEEEAMASTTTTNRHNWLRPLARDYDLDDELRNSCQRQQSSDAYQLMLRNERSRLPIYSKMSEILRLIDSHQVVVVSGDTGCGKTTQLPQYLLDSQLEAERGSLTRIIVTQPRRISALSVADRVAEERGEQVGIHSIGYQIRLESRLPKRSPGCILYCTTGVVLQWVKSNPRLEGISHLVLDEVHERDFLCDFLLNLVKRLLPTRLDLKVILMSATMEIDRFCAYFDNCPHLHVEGRLHPVQSYYLEDAMQKVGFYLPKPSIAQLAEQSAQMLKATTTTNGKSRSGNRQQQHVSYDKTCSSLPPHMTSILRAVGPFAYPNANLVALLVDHLVNTTTNGAILVFVSGLAAIKSVIQELRQRNPTLYGQDSRLVRIYPLHSMLPTGQQRALFANPPPGQRKIIVSTNIAETSVTIEDVVYVIDTGLIKMTNYDPTVNSASLAPVLVAKANALQRRGRAGRVRPGVCYHLFSRAVYDQCMADQLPPEMLRMRLEEIILRIMLLDESDSIPAFLSTCLDPPSKEAVDATLHFLHAIQAIRPRKSLRRRPPLDDTTLGSSSSSKHRRRQLRDYARQSLHDYTSGTLESPDQILATVDDDPYSHCKLTPLGRHLASLPLDPQCAKLIILGSLFGCLAPSLAVAACLSDRDPFIVSLDQSEAIRRVKLELANGSFSDHWLYVVAIQKYLQIASPYDRSRFCKDHFLQESVMRDTRCLSLLQTKFTPCKDGFVLVELLGRLYLLSSAMTLVQVPTMPSPIICTIGRSPPNKERTLRTLLTQIFSDYMYLKSVVASFDRAVGALKAFQWAVKKREPGGADLRSSITCRPGEESPSIGMSSVNANLPVSSPHWMVYFTKTRINNNNSQKKQEIVIDSWIKIACSPEVARIMGEFDQREITKELAIITMPSIGSPEELRACLNNVLARQFRDPKPLDWIAASPPQSWDVKVVQSVIHLLARRDIDLPVVANRSKAR